MNRTLDPDGTCLRIRSMCREKNINAGRLAEYLNVSDQAVYAWFSMRKLPSTDHLVELADFLEVPVDELIVTKEFQSGCVMGENIVA